MQASSMYSFSNSIELYNPDQPCTEIIPASGEKTRNDVKKTKNDVMTLASQIGDRVSKVKLFWNEGKLDPERLRVFASRCTRCKELDLSYDGTMDDAKLRQFAEALSKSSVEVIQLRSIPGITADGLKHLHALPRIKQVVLQHNVQIQKPPKHTNYRFEVTILPWLGYSC